MTDKQEHLYGLLERSGWHHGTGFFQGVQFGLTVVREPSGENKNGFHVVDEGDGWGDNWCAGKGHGIRRYHRNASMAENPICGP
jgi:hypothetical protein